METEIERNSPRIVAKWLKTTNQSRYGIAIVVRFDKRGKRIPTTVYDDEKRFNEAMNAGMESYVSSFIYDKLQDRKELYSFTSDMRGRNMLQEYLNRFNREDAEYITEILDYSNVMVCYNYKKTNLWLNHIDSLSYRVYNYFKDNIRPIFK